MNTELKEALMILEQEKGISQDTLLEAIEQSLLQACKNHFGKADNVIEKIIKEKEYKTNKHIFLEKEAF